MTVANVQVAVTSVHVGNIDVQLGESVRSQGRNLTLISKPLDLKSKTPKP